MGPACRAGPSRTSATGYGAGDLQGTYRDVEYIQATRVVLPMEIVQPTNSLSLPKQKFNFEFSFSFPYLLLAIDGFDNVLDGTNESIRRSFCMFIYETDYKAPNGRGYVILKPAQDELKRFSPPVASLRDLRVSLLKPNGTLLNNSTDNYLLKTVQYDQQNRLYLKIVTEQFFDRNEFYVGDMVRFRGFRIAPSATSSTTVDSGTFASLAEFVNRAQGHELVLLGPANDQGFYKTFYILAPGVLDQGAGRIIIDAKLISAVQTLNTVTDPASLDGPVRIMNVSLQNVVTMRVGLQANDPARLPAPPLSAGA